ncbi:cytochrome c [Flavobacteriaceae bacterium]|jgi:mono/diheme cytochrome c family protein|nr:cytochrome c [Flavobacteriaceae bacterium]MDB4590265.1 cytochrome c [Flavobacteriaceae bacterium]MDC6467940.1 cytochrome c [Flavobacteriaceae bacterium]
MKNIVNIAVTILIMLSVTSCFDKKKPNYRYMPNMYTSVAVETYSEYEILPNGQAALTPVKGTISRGWMPYEYENTQEGKALATKELKIPLAVNEENLAKGKELFNIYCAICHGNKGDGQGTLVKREKFLGIPSLADKGRNITEGDIYHVMMYGLNSMGSYASQTNEKERWQITMHALDLKSKLNGEPLWSSTQKDSMEKETTSKEAN